MPLVEKRLDSSRARLGKITPNKYTEEQLVTIQGIVAAEFEEFSENKVKNEKYTERCQDGPYVAENRSAETELEIGETQHLNKFKV
jgi:hypothetical protein